MGREICWSIHSCDPPADTIPCPVCPSLYHERIGLTVHLSTHRPGGGSKIPKCKKVTVPSLYKLYERMIIARMSLTVEEYLTPDQAGFRPGRSTCGQLLNLTQYIVDGFEEKQITGTVFVDLTAAYDTVNQKILLLKVAKMIKNKKIVSIIQTLLENRRFAVEMDGRKSRWQLQKNGLPQGSVLAPTLFNIYTNDQPEFDHTRRFIYADDLYLATQSTSFNAIETRLTDALSSLFNYYTENSLNANPSKAQECAFHLNNHQANTKLEITWNDQPLNRILFRSMGQICHAKKVDAELNNACRIVTGQLKPTPLPLLYRTAGIAPRDIRRQTHGSTEKHKQEIYLRHPLFDHSYPRARLKSRKSFRTVESVQPDQAARQRLELWNTWDNTTNEAIQTPKEQLPSGRELQRKDWVTLNRARAKAGKTASALHKWKLRLNSECPCGNQNQTMDHILSECTEGPHCTDQDLRDCTDAAQAWITHWRDKI
ncbi:RNA-directed DNA polymerase from mobile element jockey [Elysia marginata]|uniref:RNA-directed DNA polymerase from mobile element jockey n=1 Tax=Elysia marginata TaxID=1093978 RepID=A0AAV4J3H9_9GAST|nr:RNA-directed DNA polymerase from mobile element jockey [Elysia marginata]